MTTHGRTLLDAIRDTVTVRPAAVALIDARTDEHITYAELIDDVERLGSVLLASGVQERDTVFLVAERSARLVEMMLAVSRIGAVSLPVVLPDLVRPSFDACMTVSRRMHFFADAASLDVARIKVPEVEWLSVDALCRTREAAAIAHNPVASSPFYVNTTSASTGLPKLVLVTHDQLILNTAASVRAFGIGRHDRHLCTFSCHPHEFFARALLTGGAAVLLDNAHDPSALLEALEKYRVTCLMSSVIVYSGIQRIAERAIPSLRLAECGGSPVSVRLSDAVEKKIGIRLTPVWGSTETTGVALAPPPGVRVRDGSVGLPIPGYEARIINEQGCEITNGDAGQLVISGPAVAAGYFNDSVGLNREARFYTGDAAKKDADGWIYVIGRTGNEFKVGGVKINAEHVEAVFLDQANVSAAIVVPVPHRYLGWQAAAVVEVTGHSESAQAIIDTLLASVATELSHPLWELPRRIVLVDRIPRTPAGKLDRIAAQRLALTRRGVRGRHGSLRLLRDAVLIGGVQRIIKFFKRPLSALRLSRFMYAVHTREEYE